MLQQIPCIYDMHLAVGARAAARAWLANSLIRCLRCTVATNPCIACTTSSISARWQEEPAETRLITTLLESW